MVYSSIGVTIGNPDHTASDWLSLEWSSMQPIASWLPDDVPGVYRILGGSELLYCGQSASMRTRIRTHQRNPRFAGAAISVHEMLSAKSHHLKERETDLIGAFFGSTGGCPTWQYRPKVV